MYLITKTEDRYTYGLHSLIYNIYRKGGWGGRKRRGGGEGGVSLFLRLLTPAPEALLLLLFQLLQPVCSLLKSPKEKLSQRT